MWENIPVLFGAYGDMKKLKGNGRDFSMPKTTDRHPAIMMGKGELCDFLIAMMGKGEPCDFFFFAIKVFGHRFL